MAAKKTTIEKAAAAAARAAIDASNESSIVIDDSDDEIIEAEHEALESLREFDDGSGGVKFYLSGNSGPGDRRGVIEVLTASDIPDLLAHVMEKYGPGRYRVYATRGGKFIKSSNRSLVISSLAPKPTPAAASAPSDTAPQGEMARWEERQERLRQESREDRKNWLTLAFGALGALGPALISMMKPNSIVEQAQALAALKALGDSKDPEKMVELLVKGMEMGKDLGGGDAGWPGIIREALASAKPLLEGRAAAAQPQPQAQVLTVRPAIAQAPKSQPTAAVQPPPGEVNEMLAIARPLLTKLANDLTDFAEAAAPPDLAAEALAAKIPSAYRAMVKEEDLKSWLANPDWWTHVSAFHPPLAPYRDFCDKVRLLLLESFNPEDEETRPA